MERIDIGETSIEVEIAGAGRPLLFLHGEDYFAQNRPFLDRLAQQWKVIVPRHPGFGGTRRPSWFRAVSDIAYLYLDLLDAQGLDDLTVVGSSFGGWVALEMAVRSMARIGRLALIGSLGVKFSGREDRDIADLLVLSAAEVARHVFADPSLAPDYGTMAEDELEKVAADREAAVMYGWRPYMHNPALVHWLHRVIVPTLVLWGDQDRVVAPAYGEKLAAAIPGASFRQIAGSGHYPQIEQTESVAAAIEEFAR
ncbi:MAG TPA: alpha/beta hydrolase [Stellaceae bacterium]|jgi:pimeloyl-ACP methyl ester carboxylesterase|nr:alpha/beta hydrolase [Stellaceae bacterium]